MSLLSTLVTALGVAPPISLPPGAASSRSHHGPSSPTQKPEVRVRLR
ncbi:MAG: hypothetical protein JNK45_13765, partial [Myxococcales bacterium]|nr:hypothetical protein [Myxococcales bacterium]